MKRTFLEYYEEIEKQEVYIEAHLGLDDKKVLRIIMKSNDPTKPEFNWTMEQFASSNLVRRDNKQKVLAIMAALKKEPALSQSIMTKIGPAEASSANLVESIYDYLVSIKKIALLGKQQA